MKFFLSFVAAAAIGSLLFYFFGPQEVPTTNRIGYGALFGIGIQATLRVSGIS